jgi:hypothetical protein
MISTTADVTRFNQALVGGRLLRPAELTAMKTTVRAPELDPGWPGVWYGLGLMEVPLSYILDLRTAPESARTWLDKERATWNIGAGWPDPTEYTAAIGKAHDILIHLHDVEATTYLGTS